MIGERGGTRTHDPLIKSQMLYRLSYALAFLGARYLLPGPLRVNRKRAGLRDSGRLQPGEIFAGVM